MVVSGFGTRRIKKGAKGGLWQVGLRLGGLNGGEHGIETLLELATLFR
jgi:hypothetical protein